MTDWTALSESGVLSAAGGRNPSPSASGPGPLHVGAGINGSYLSLAWSGGAGPFVIQTKTNLSDAEWTDVVTVTNQSSASVTFKGPCGFFRIVDRAAPGGR
jgi:hypothetical protein